ncbi:RNA-binding protein [Halospeciosus flavus]|uniref:RNA-binding protein n=1 Tax=Halospeciosus flavus TaxID=3032283 RepID=A0ABD5Z290_9EURY|nr:RNA-binding protein [Halospeciosus flavus]
MSNVPFHYIDLRTFAYDTEDEQRVVRALEHYLPEEVEIQRAESRGHHGDRILVLSARVERSDEMRHVIEQLREGADLERLREELDQRVNENCAFMAHLDKQAAFQGESALGQGITFRAKVEAYPAKREAAVENAREAL